MKKGMVIGIVLIIAVVVVLVANVIKSTGNATLTPKAYYNPIESHTNVYIDCAYVTKSDGWSVTTASKISYFDRLNGMTKEVVDFCETSTKVREYDCKSGSLAERPVICPPSQTCKEGMCL